ncbi:phosphotransferase, partial [Arthrobacter deserti]|nr:phosphotransferase [Arthrobacter deserti]
SPQEAVAWQEAVLEHLARRPISVEVPRMLPNRQGQVHCSVAVGGEQYLLRLLTWIAGELMAAVEEHPRVLLRQLGRVAAETTRAMEGLVQPAGVSAHHWLVTRSLEAIEDSFDAVKDPECRQAVVTIQRWFQDASKAFDRLPTATVHQDLNDFNVLVTVEASGEARIAGVLDFNDSVTTIRVAELAVAGAYAMLRKADPLSAFCEVVSGYREVIEMTEEELDVVFPLAAARLC